MTWREAKDKYETNKHEIENIKRVNESKRQQKVAEKATVELLRKIGNQLFMDKRYEDAASTYSRAIDTDEGSLSAVLYSNRSAAYLYIGRKEDALNDALLARQLSFSRWPKAYFRVAKARYELGMFTDAYQAADIGLHLAQSIVQCQERHASDLKCTNGDILELFALKSKAMRDIESEMFTYTADEFAENCSDESKNVSQPTAESMTSSSESEGQVKTFEDRAAFIEEEITEQSHNDSIGEIKDAEEMKTKDNSSTPSTEHPDSVQVLLADPQWSTFLNMMDKHGPGFALKWAESDPLTSLLMNRLKDLLSKQGKKVDFLSARNGTSSESKCSDEYLHNLKTYLSTSVTVLTQRYEYDDETFGESKVMDSPKYIVNSKKENSTLNPFAKEFVPTTIIM